MDAMTKPMKILFVVGGLPPYAGTTLFVNEMAHQLSCLGCSVTIAVKIKVANQAIVSSTVRVVLLDDILDGRVNDEWDIVHIHGCWQKCLHKTCLWAAQKDLPFVISPHGMLQPFALRRGFLKKWIALKVYQMRDIKKAAAIHVCSLSERHALLALGIRRLVIQVPLGVTIRWSTDELMKLKKSPHGRKRTALFLSRIHRDKGIFTLVDAWIAICSQSPALAKQWQLQIVGIDKYGCLEKIREMISRSNCCGNVELCGPAYGEARDRLFASADFLVVPSFTENFGAVVIESLSCATPVITTTGTPWSKLEDKMCGRWIGNGVEPLVEAMTSMMQLEDNVRLEMGLRGYEMVKNEYTWPLIGESLLTAYSKIPRRPS